MIRTAGKAQSIGALLGVSLLVSVGLVTPAQSGSISALVAASLTDLTSALALYRGSPAAPELAAAADGSVQLDAPPSLVAEVVVRAHECGFSGEELLSLLQRTQHLADRDLPVGPVLSRYLEGMAKGVPYARIDAAAGSLEGLLASAGEQFNTGFPTAAGDAARRARLASIDHAAYALGLGMSCETLQAPMQLALEDEDPYEAAQAPLLTLGILVDSGIEPEASLEVVNLAWTHGYRGDSMERLGVGLGRVAADPGAVAEVLDMISSGAAQDRVFEGLDELVDRNIGLRSPGLSPGEDPGSRRGRTPSDDIHNKVKIDDDRPSPGNDGPGTERF